MIRGRGRNLEIAVDRALPAAAAELRTQLEERGSFFRGSRAVANLGPVDAGPAELAELRDLLAEFGVTLDGVSGPEALAPMLAELELAYLGHVPVAEVAPLPRSRAPRNVALSESARSLVADFAGARADLAQRRTRREAAAVHRAVAGPPAAAGVTIPPTPAAAPAGVSTLYHRGTLRGGQALHNLGNIVVIGDVNPGAELIASGDIVVFGALRGVAHAGAQGDASARVVALELAPTQLRISTLIAMPDAPEGFTGNAGAGPQHAYVSGERIAVVSHFAADLGRREVTL
ncbi:MAG: septum site-determining protein MinC [Candidatus Velthaea sp.]